MANQIQVTLTASAVNGTFTDYINPSGLTITQNALGKYDDIVSAATAGTTVTAGVTTLGWAFFHNLDGSNYVQIGNYISSTFYPFAKLKAGEYAWVRIDPAITALRLVANTSAVNVRVCIYND